MKVFYAFPMSTANLHSSPNGSRDPDSAPFTGSMSSQGQANICYWLPAYKIWWLYSFSASL